MRGEGVAGRRDRAKLEWQRERVKEGVAGWLVGRGGGIRGVGLRRQVLTPSLKVRGGPLVSFILVPSGWLSPASCGSFLAPSMAH